MNDRITRGENEQTVVREMVTDMYQRYETLIEQIVSETILGFSHAGRAFTALTQYMNFPELGQRSYTAIPTFLPFSPLDQDQFYFSIAMAIAHGQAKSLSYVAIGIHEVSHFILLEQYKSWRRQSALTLTDPAYHYFKEALTAAVMDQPEFRTFFDYRQLFKSEAYPGNPELRDLQVEIDGNIIPLIEVFRRDVIHYPDGYLAGLHRLCEYLSTANEEFNKKWKIWNDVGGSFEYHPKLLDAYRKPIRLQVRG